MGKPNHITMVDLRQHAVEIVDRVRRGQSLVLIYRGKPSIRLEPVRASDVSSEDPFYRLGANPKSDATNLANDEIDKIVYGT